MNPPDPLNPSADELVVLDADLLAEFDLAHGADEVPADVAARIKLRVFQRIAEADRQIVAIAADSDTWKPFLPGVTIKVLHRTGDLMSYLLRMQPGSVLPAHRHPHEEECVVLEGSLHIGDLRLSAGGYLLVHEGVLHGELVAEAEGATLYLRGARPRAEHVVG
jgi:quercetin dioxygenase-like cupin family protein